MDDLIEVSKSDLQKIYDALKASEEHLLLRDKMNAKLHLASEVRLSPLTSSVISERERLEIILKE